MRYKKGVPEELHINMVRLLPVIDYISDAVCGRPAIITSTTDGKHMSGSLHYKGLAVDLRIRDLAPDEQERYYDELKLALSKLCDVVLESDHIHVEYSPTKY
jgi:hypothetical protein